MSKNFVCQNCNQNLRGSDLQAHCVICKNTQFKQTFRTANDNDISPNHKYLNMKSDPYYEMKEGMVTFRPIPEAKNIENSSSESNMFKKNSLIQKDKTNSENPTKSLNKETNNIFSDSDIDKIIKRDVNEKDVSEEKFNQFNNRDNNITDVPDKFGGIGILNSINDNNSFLAAIFQTIWNLQKMRNYLIYDVDISETDSKNKLIFHLKVFYYNYRIV